MNACPDFIDGHQHIHQLPVIRDVLLSVCANSHVFFRSTSHGWSDVLSLDAFPKRQLITLLGGATFHKRLKQQNLARNSSFSGIYNFSNAANYRYYFKRFLMHSQDDGLIMCHPGNPSSDVHDPLRFCRHHELNYFMSDHYISDLVTTSFQLKCKEFRKV